MHGSRSTPATPHGRGDVHPVLRRAAEAHGSSPVPGLLAQAQHGLDEAARLTDPNERYATAHLAALRTAAAVLAARTSPARGRGRRRRPGIRPVWEVLTEVAPELAEWSALFASGADRRARAEAGIPGAAGAREAAELLHAAEVFLRLVERTLVTQPALPQPRVAPADEEPPADAYGRPGRRRAG
ncbi:SAV_6107 family HEPN domain-containing protein [Streptomyces sp. HNM0574]|uniref:SAV_6107 family HEPN domain-containing protein n=1 Tax=Streptomyces sp. HNM0574 TaxID=2714954 RepID=UPI00146D1CC1|nr:SAV_6107 family HEPN domain-containing protein [Streptomyces sp. HNM0574]NLU67642.1 hypothetical protein [Streptomyces sp. HNM0574]